MIKREPFKPTIRKEDFLSEEKYLIGVENSNIGIDCETKGM